jgi:hypothetical protein
LTAISLTFFYPSCDEQAALVDAFLQLLCMSLMKMQKVTDGGARTLQGLIDITDNLVVFLASSLGVSVLEEAC